MARDVHSYKTRSNTGPRDEQTRSRDEETHGNVGARDEETHRAAAETLNYHRRLYLKTVCDVCNHRWFLLKTVCDEASRKGGDALFTNDLLGADSNKSYPSDFRLYSFNLGISCWPI